MKKVLALVLAVMMLSTMAFASSNNDLTTNDNILSFGGDVFPGDCLYIYDGMDSGVPGTDMKNPDTVTTGEAAIEKEVNSKNYRISNKRVTENPKLVKDIYFDDKNNQLCIEFVEDYTLQQKKTVTGSFMLRGIGKDAPKAIAVEFSVTVGNRKGRIALNTDADCIIDENMIKDNTVYKFQGSDADTFAKDGLYDTVTGALHPDCDNYGTVSLTCKDDGETEVSFRAYKNDEVFLFNNAKANSALLKAYADEDAEISFLNFVANPTLNSTATIRFYKDETSHVYVMKDGKLTSEVKWNDDEDCFVLKTRTLGSYVFSDKALPFNVSTPSNPDTGANDVVGIATALAAVALVSAAAVSLKK